MPISSSSTQADIEAFLNRRNVLRQTDAGRTQRRTSLKVLDAGPVHPRRGNARVLLTSVFGPYARDDAEGSRELNPMELYHNQVTRVQGPFSLRMFHRSWGLKLIQENIAAPCTLLDFPTRDRFLEELSTQRYDVIGISAIIPNLTKVRIMCEMIRASQPHASIIVGGHISNYPGLDRIIDADHIVRGEGVEWMRRYLGESTDRPLLHPRILSGIGARAMGIRLRERPGDVAAVLLPSVGCPMGCNFCATSAMFGGKGACIHFYETGDQLFEVMCGLERDMRIRSFFVMDENFLLHRKRALRLLDLMEQNGKSWSLYIFSSANVIGTYSMEQIVGLGVSWIWMGLEGESAEYAKLRNIDTHVLVRELQSHGVRVLGSSIIGLENHSPENIDRVIDYAVSHATEFHQFMLYTPIPGTALHAEHQRAGSLLPAGTFDEADIHGQEKFNFRHPLIPAGMEGKFLIRAFLRDFEVNGPSVARIARTVLQGWRRYRNHPNPRIRARFEWESRDLSVTAAAALRATRSHFVKSRPPFLAAMNETLREIHREYGLRSRFLSLAAAQYIGLRLRREDRRLRRGMTYEPPTFCERNEAAEALAGWLPIGCAE